MSPFTLGACMLVLLVLFLLHLRELRALRSAVSLLGPRAAPACATPATTVPTPAASRPEPEASADRDSMDVLTQVMPNPIKAAGAEQPPSRPAQIAAGLARPKSQRSPAVAKAPHPPPVKVRPPPQSAPPPPLPPVTPPPRPPARSTSGTLLSMPALAPIAPAPDERSTREKP